MVIKGINAINSPKIGLACAGQQVQLADIINHKIYSFLNASPLQDKSRFKSMWFASTTVVDWSMVA